MKFVLSTLFLSVVKQELVFMRRLGQIESYTSDVILKKNQFVLIKTVSLTVEIFLSPLHTSFWTLQTDQTQFRINQTGFWINQTAFWSG